MQIFYSFFWSRKFVKNECLIIAQLILFTNTIATLQLYNLYLYKIPIFENNLHAITKQISIIKAIRRFNGKKQ